MKGDTDEVRPLTAHHSIGGQFSIRQGPWILLLTNQVKGGWGGMPGQESIETKVDQVQLYHLGDDPGERTNLETTHPGKIKELVGLLAKAMADGRTTPGEVQENEGWPMLQKDMIQLFPELGEPE